ncbi:cytochrome C biogenesis protein CcdA [Alicyclobacillus cellulosilyticus]|uniref:Cytochrome C biogenesis protein CcdA n=1 Tax=Alicyclobacillus cellulosilyticus TaxID=1003997 RepID=A0A917K2U6_9BACL|nr:cytochrome c biogenesis protein CcdA [Alicyclobacillus cellulosilyticus]GGI96663.1 cytochrome C biogenesis protein CcdA [Alicyclobacillus cellulosilyticus]
MTVATHPTLWLAFLAGMLSFLSPCCLPLYPSYISYISGVTFGADEKYAFNHRLRALTHTFCFIVGFSIIFYALGMSASLFGQVFVNYRSAIRMVGGIIVFFMGLFLTGLVTPKWMLMERKWAFQATKTSYIASILVGVSFAAGWSPCIGPILAAVLVMAATQSMLGLTLITAYILGFALPFFILGFTLGSVRKLAQYGAVLTKAGGYVMMVLGLLLMTNTMSKITVVLIKLYGGFTGF